jgi:RNA polymerase-binding transcription factor DksA
LGAAFAPHLRKDKPRLLVEIGDARRSIQDETNGVCEAMNEATRKARRRTIPWTHYCIDCARKRERWL